MLASFIASPLALGTALASGLGEFITLQAWRLRDRIARAAANR